MDTPGNLALRHRREMDLYKAIQDLYAEKEKLERVIASLEELQRTAGALPVLPAKPSNEAGRKSMNSAERQEVSERMRKYWAAAARASRKPSARRNRLRPSRRPVARPIS